MYTSYNEPKNTCTDRSGHSGKAEVRYSVLTVVFLLFLLRWLLEDTIVGLTQTSVWFENKSKLESRLSCENVHLLHWEGLPKSHAALWL